MEGSPTPGAAGGLLLRQADGLPAAHSGHLVPAWELRIADFARHLSLAAGERTGRSYLDVLHRLAAFGADPLEAERGDLERFLARPRRGRHGDWQDRLLASTQTTELAGRRRFYGWAREEGLREDNPIQGLWRLALGGCCGRAGASWRDRHT